jgi:hypothetical protein
MRVRALLVATLLACTLALVVSPAIAGGPLRYANWNDVGRRMSICAQDLAVRSYPGGPAFAYMYSGQTILIKDAGQVEFGGEWVYGFVYGNVNAHGYIQNGWFCYGQG